MNHAPFASEQGAEDALYVEGRTRPSLDDPEAMSPRLRRRRAFTLVLLTLVLPGSAQLAAGHRRLGRIGVRAWLAVLASGVLLGLVLLVSRPLALGLFGRSWFLTGVQWLLVGFALLWATLFVDAWRLGQPRRLVLDARRWLTGLTAALLVVTSGGLVYAANTVSAGRDALNAMFGSHTTQPSTDGRYNVLLLGGDTGAGRVGTRPDSIQLASIDEETGRAVMFGFSRDTENINFRPGSVMQRLMPEGWNCGDECLLNGLYTWAQDHRDRFPAEVAEPGVLATREAVEALSGLTVHYYVMVDLRGFQTMVDALGGLDLTVQKRTPIGGGTSRISGWIEPGRQHLDGYHALWYARAREGSTNYERMARQRCVMTAMIDQLDPQTVLLKFGDLAAASSTVIHSDLPQSELGFFADLALKTRSQKIKSVNFVPPLIKPWDYDPQVVRSTVARTIAASEGATDRPKPSTAGKAAPPSRSGSASGSTTGTRPSQAPRTGPAAGSLPGGASEADLSSVCSRG